MTMKLVSPRDIRLLADNVACLETAAEFRIKRGLICPRCQSNDVHVAILRPGSGRIYPQFHCVDCGYVIKVTSGTFAMGSQILLKQYVQVLTLSNALGTALPKAKAAKAAAIRSLDGLNSVLERVARVDPGVRFAYVDPITAGRVRDPNRLSDASGSEAFFVFCDANSIVIDLDALIQSLSVIFTTVIPEFVETFKHRGRPYAPRQKLPKPMPESSAISTKSMIPKTNLNIREDGIHKVRKALADEWIARFAESLPDASVKQRTALAWQLAALGIDSDQGLRALENSPGNGIVRQKPALAELRSKYLQAKTVA